MLARRAWKLSVLEVVAACTRAPSPPRVYVYTPRTETTNSTSSTEKLARRVMDPETTKRLKRLSLLGSAEVVVASKWGIFVVLGLVLDVVLRVGEAFLPLFYF